MQPGPLRLLAERLGVTAALVVFMAPVLWLVMVAYEPGKDIFGVPPPSPSRPRSRTSEPSSAISTWRG